MRAIAFALALVALAGARQAEPVDAPFAPVSALVDAGMPADAMFIPLPSGVFAECLPLQRACADPDSGLVLVAARRHSVLWSASEDPPSLAPLFDSRGLSALRPVGPEPRDAQAKTFVLTVLDVDEHAGNGELRALQRKLDGDRQLAAATATDTTSTTTRSTRDAFVAATIDPAVTVTERETTRSPFGRPYRVTTTKLTEASPVIVAYGSAAPQVLYALRTPEDWGFGRRSLPLLGNGRVPYLARPVEGPPGLVVPIPAAMDAQLGAAPAAGSADIEGVKVSGEAKETDNLVVLTATAVVIAAALVVLRVRRRPSRTRAATRSPHGPRSRQDRSSGSE